MGRRQSLTWSNEIRAHPPNAVLRLRVSVQLAVRFPAVKPLIEIEE